MVRVKMLISTYSTDDGYAVSKYEEGKQYDVTTYNASMLLVANKAIIVKKYSTESF